MIALQQFAESPATAAPLTLAVRPDSARDDVLRTWREIERRLPACPLACSADWTETWLAHYGPLVPHRFVLIHRGASPVAAAVVARGAADRDGMMPVRTWHIGTAGEPDAHSICVEYNSLLCDPNERGAVWRELLAWFDRRDDWDEIRCDGFADDELADFVDHVPAWRLVRKPARYVDLDEVRRSGRDLLQIFGDSTRKGLRQKLRHYDGAVVEWAESVNHATDIFAELIRLHQERWQADGQPGCYASPVFTEFHRELLERLVPQGRMALFRVRHRGVAIGCSQLLIDRNRVLVYQGGRLAGEAKHSPGLVTDYLAMGEALQRGYSAYDFLAGDSVHKQRLSTHAADLVWAVRRRPRLRFAVMDQLRQIKRWVQSLHDSGEI